MLKLMPQTSDVNWSKAVFFVRTLSSNQLFDFIPSLYKLQLQTENKFSVNKSRY